MWINTLLKVVITAGLLSFCGDDTVAGQPGKEIVPPADEPFPKEAIARLGTDRWRHGSRVLCLAYSPNERYLAAGGGDDPVRLWDTATGTEVRNLPEPWVNALAWSPRSSVLVTAGAFKTIRLWASASGKEIGQLKGHNAAVKSLAVSPDGSLLASGDQDGALLVWEFTTREQVCKFAGHTGEILALAFSPNNSLLASAGGDRTIHIWDADHSKPLGHVDGKCAVSALVFLDDKTLASGGDDHLIHFWDVPSGKHLGSLAGHQDTVASLALLPGSKTLVSGGHDRTIRFWDPTRRVQIGQLDRHPGDSDALALSRDGKFLASAGLNNTIRRWTLPENKEIQRTSGHPAPVSALAIAPNGKLAASASAVGDIRIWDPAAGRHLRHWPTPGDGDTLLVFSPDSTVLASARGGDGVRLWHPHTGQPEKHLPGMADDPVLNLAFAPDGQHLAVTHGQRTLRIWNILQGRITQSIPLAEKAGQALAYAPDGRMLAVGGAGVAVLYHPQTGKEIRRLAAREEPLLPALVALAFTPDGKTLAGGFDNAAIRLWDTGSGKEIGTLEGHQSMVNGLAFSSDGRNLMSGSFDQTVRCWEIFIEPDPAKGKRLAGKRQPMAIWKGHKGAVTCLGLAPGGRLAISGSADTSLLLWDLTGRSPQGKLLPWLPQPADLQSAWLELASEDSARGRRALWDFVAARQTGLDFIDKNLFLLNPQHLAQLLENLDHQVFKIRDNASKELARHGRWIEPALEAEMKKDKVSEEKRRRIRDLLTALRTPGSLTAVQERLRYHRLMQILEQNANPQARVILVRMTTGGPEDFLRDQAHATLARLKKGH